ncbi:MAG TPA: hypothetical protein DEP05_03465 [Betaproteobacteria bacterium]|nr:hypothetical protein [Betaproteobacteria bacterium]
MKRDVMISDELVNAFVDHQLDEAEKSRLFDLVEQDEVLNRRVCECHRLKEMVRHAYDHPPAAGRREGRKRRFAPYLQSLVAGLLLLIGAGAGWFAHGQPRLTEHAANLPGLLREAKAPVVLGGRVILHVGSSRPAELRAALDTTEYLLRVSKHSNQQLQLEVIANGGGLDLLRTGVSPYARRIRLLQRTYPNLSFLACHQTVTHLRQEGVAVKLLPGIREAPSALAQVVKRLQEGWQYIQA